MSLNPIAPRLRVVNKSNAVAKVQVPVPAGEVLEVSAEMAASLFASSSAFAPVVDEVPANDILIESEPVKRGPGRPRKVAE